MQAPGQVQRGSGKSSEGSGEGLGRFGAEPGQVQQGSEEGSGEGLGGLVQSPVSLNRVPETVPEKVWEALVQSQVRRRFRRRFREALVQSQVRFNRVEEKVPEKVWEALEHAQVFPALGFAACFRKICKDKPLRLLGIPPKLISYFSDCLNVYQILKYVLPAV